MGKFLSCSGGLWPSLNSSSFLRRSQTAAAGLCQAGSLLGGAFCSLVVFAYRVGCRAAVIYSLRGGKRQELCLSFSARIRWKFPLLCSEAIFDSNGQSAIRMRQSSARPHSDLFGSLKRARSTYRRALRFAAAWSVRPSKTAWSAQGFSIGQRSSGLALRVFLFEQDPVLRPSQGRRRCARAPKLLQLKPCRLSAKLRLVSA